MSSKINLQTCEYACKSSIFQDNQLIYLKSNILIILGIIYILFVIYSIYNDEKIDSNIKKYVSNIEMLNEIYENVQTSIVCINHAIIKECSIVIRDSRFVNEFHILKATCKFCTRLSTFVMTFPFFPLLL